jgi:DNA polymerase III delta subunit
MIYLIYGTDQERARDKWRALSDSLRKKRPEASYFQLDQENFDRATLAELEVGQTLFGTKYIVAADCLAEIDSAYLEERAEALAGSPHIFIFLEKTIDNIPKLCSQAEKAQQYERQEERPREKFNVFIITDALGARDRKKLWVHYQKALLAGVESEEIYWRLVWQVKNMLIAAEATTAEQKKLGVKPFVAEKSKKFATNYKREELLELYKKLVDLYHATHLSEREMEIGLERTLLEI